MLYLRTIGFLSHALGEDQHFFFPDITCELCNTCRNQYLLFCSENMTVELLCEGYCSRCFEKRHFILYKAVMLKFKDEIQTFTQALLPYTFILSQFSTMLWSKILLEPSRTERAKSELALLLSSLQKPKSQTICEHQHQHLRVVISSRIFTCLLGGDLHLDLL